MPALPGVRIFVEDGTIAEYSEDLSTQEAKVVFGDNRGEITFSLGEIRVAD